MAHKRTLGAGLATVFLATGLGATGFEAPRFDSHDWVLRFQRAPREGPAAELPLWERARV